MAHRSSHNSVMSSLLVVLALFAIVLTSTLASASLTPTVSISSSPNGSSVLGQSVTFTATVNGGGPTPTGQVVFYDGTQLIGIAQLDGTGNANFPTALLNVGNHLINASYGGDSNHSASDAPVFPFTVNPRQVNMTVPRPAAVGVGATGTITANVFDALTAPVGPNAAIFTSTGTLPANNLQSLRSGHAAVQLADGTVLIIGGTVGGVPVNTVELYNPVTGTFTSVTGSLINPRSGHTATLLSDGQTILVAGGDTNGDAELYSYNLSNPGTGSSVATGSLQQARSGHTATLLPNGQVLIIGGTVGGSANCFLEVYDSLGASSTLITNGSLVGNRSGHSTTLLSYSGTLATLLVAGGDAGGTAEVITYDFSTTPGTVTQVGLATWLTARTGHTATLLPDGKSILFTGGVQSGRAVASAEIYQIPSSLVSFTSFVTVPTPLGLNIARTGHTATLLSSAFVLFTGGEADTNPPTQSAELYTPAFDPLGTIAIASDDPTDTITCSPCTLVLGGNGGSSCSASLIPNAVDSGSRSINALYSSDGNHVSGGSTNAPLTVNLGTQATVHVSAPPSAFYGQAGLSAVASGGSGTGAYSYSAGASTACSVDPNSGALTITSASGSCAITAIRAADPNYLVSAPSAAASVSVGQTPQTITFPNPGPQAFGVAPITLTASSTSGLLITYTVTSGPAMVSGSTLTITGVGSVTVQATQAGNANYTAATPVSVTFATGMTATTTTLATSVATVLLQSNVTLTATVASQNATPAGSVTFMDGAKQLGSATLGNAGTATLTLTTLALGSHSITAVYAGNLDFVGSASSATTVSVQDFSFVANGGTATVLSTTVMPGDKAVYTVQFVPQGGSTFIDAVTLTLTGLPAGATYTITPSTIAVGSGATTVTITVNTANLTASLSSPKGGMGFPKPLMLAFFLPLLGTRKLRRALRLQMKTSALMLVVMGVLMVTGLTACGGSGFFSQAPKSYPMTLTGTSGAVHHSVTLNLTIQ